jgi:hypothetical protein
MTQFSVILRYDAFAKYDVIALIPYSAHITQESLNGFS